MRRLIALAVALVAAAQLAAAERVDVRAAQAQLQHANALAIAGDYAAAAAAYQQAIRLDAGDVRPRLGLATALVLDGRCLEARESLREGLRAIPRDLAIVHALARLLVTCADPEVRDAQRAIELARFVYAATPTLECGETLGMAYAASGAFEEAARVQAELLARAEQAGDAAWTARLRANLERYQRGEVR
jgi:tetratricopeptide (TPR) repeat protein